MRIHYLVLAIVFITTLGCAREDSSKVKQDSIYTTYNVDYNAGNNTLYAEAYFNFGGSLGTYLQLDGSSTVTFNGEKMDEEINIINQVIYKNNKTNLSQDQIKQTQTFFYRSNDNIEYTNSFTLPALVSVQYEHTTIDTNSTIVANWSSENIIGPDDLFLSIFNVNQGNTVRQNSENDISNSISGVIIVPQTKIAELGAGTFKVKICREYFGINLNTPPEGGYLAATSCSVETNITITNNH